MKLSIPPVVVGVWLPGQAIPPIEPGDLLLVRHHGLLPSLIRWAERLRRPRGISRGSWTTACTVNHACIAVTGSPDVVVSQEAGHGDELTPLPLLKAAALAVVRFQADDAQRAAGVAFARAAVGSGYGYVQIVADLFNALTGLELGLGIGNAMVCSTMSCRTIERYGLIPDRSAASVTPTHLALWTGAQVPAV
jgi:hypothetical protein